MDEAAQGPCTVKAIAIVSGGMDSVTLANVLKSEGYDLHLLSFDYGQRHSKELEYAKRCADSLGARWSLVNLSTVTPLMAGSALTGSTPVPDGHYEAETMRVTVVPNRNAVMLAIAYAAAVSEQSDIVAIGVHSGDHFIYPDCRPEFVQAFDAMERLATRGHAAPGLRLYAPFVAMTKADIVRRGAALGVDYADTWSCYKGGAVHCGTCGTCVERKEAFELAGVNDPTIYQEAK